MSADWARSRNLGSWEAAIGKAGELILVISPARDRAPPAAGDGHS